MDDKVVVMRVKKVKKSKPPKWKKVDGPPIQVSTTFEELLFGPPWMDVEYLPAYVKPKCGEKGVEKHSIQPHKWSQVWPD